MSSPIRPRSIARCSGEDMKRLIADFNRDWPDVTRTREILVLAEEVRRGVRHRHSGRASARTRNFAPTTSDFGFIAIGRRGAPTRWRRPGMTIA